jgi:hypothetical protein
MLSKILSILTAQLDDYLRRAFRLNESIVILQPPAANSAQLAAGNKLYLFLANIERETAGGIAFNRQTASGTHFHSGMPPWQLNVYVMLAAVFNEKQYEEALILLSATAAFLQANNQFPLPGTDTQINIEPVNLSFSELSNLWSIYGSQYYPSLLCKLRNVLIDSGEIRQIGQLIRKKEEDTGKMNSDSESNANQ